MPAAFRVNHCTLTNVITCNSTSPHTAVFFLALTLQSLARHTQRRQPRLIADSPLPHFLAALPGDENRHARDVIDTEARPRLRRVAVAFEPATMQARGNAACAGNSLARCLHRLRRKSAIGTFPLIATLRARFEAERTSTSNHDLPRTNEKYASVERGDHDYSYLSRRVRFAGDLRDHACSMRVPTRAAKKKKARVGLR